MENLQINADERETVTVSGRFATGLLARRIVWTVENLSGDIGAGIGQLMNNNAINPSDMSRVIPGFSYVQNTLGIDWVCQITYKELLLAVTDICTAADVGLKTAFNPASGELTMSLYVGADSLAVFSREYDNINEQVFTFSEQSSANVALIGGEGEGAARTLVTIGTAEGLNRREMFVDAKDLREAENPGKYDEVLISRGIQKMAERVPAQSFDATVNPYGNLRYKTDYDLGSMVTVQSKPWGVAMRTRITEITESYSAEGMTLDVVFGHGLLTLSQKLKGALTLG